MKQVKRRYPREFNQTTTWLLRDNLQEIKQEKDQFKSRYLRIKKAYTHYI